MKSIDEVAHRFPMHRLPGSSRWFGPPRQSTDISALPGAEVVFRTSLGVGRSETYWDGTQAFDVGSPPSDAVYLKAEVNGGRVLDSHGWAVTSEDALIADASFAHEKREYQAWRGILSLDRPTWLPGLTLNLGSVWGDRNYAHSVLDGTGRLGMFSSHELSEVDNLLIPSGGSRMNQDVLAQLNLRGRRAVRLLKGSHFHCERLLVSSCPSKDRMYPPWLSEFFRSLNTDPSLPSKDSSRRVHMVRSEVHRALTNRREVIDILESYAFRRYEPGGLAEAAAQLGRADVVFADHGASMADIVFCRPGTIIVEIVPRNHRYPYFASLAAASNFRHIAVPADPVHRAAHSDSIVSIELVREVLNAVL